jgi:hypothetical protein
VLVLVASAQLHHRVLNVQRALSRWQLNLHSMTEIENQRDAAAERVGWTTMTTLKEIPD